MEQNKLKFPLWVYPETMNKVERLYKEDDCRSRSEFIEKAVQFYCGYLSAKDYSAYIPNIFISTMQASMDSLENRMANLMFKYAVELSMLSHVTAATTNISEETLEDLRRMCINEVKKNHGAISFENAFKFQKS